MGLFIGTIMSYIYSAFFPEIREKISFTSTDELAPIPYTQISLNDDFKACINARFPEVNLLAITYNQNLLEHLRRDKATSILISSDGLKILAHKTKRGTWCSRELNLHRVDEDIKVIIARKETFKPATELDAKHLSYLCALINVRDKGEYSRFPKFFEQVPYITIFGITIKLNIQKVIDS